MRDDDTWSDDRSRHDQVLTSDYAEQYRAQEWKRQQEVAVLHSGCIPSAEEQATAVAVSVPVLLLRTLEALVRLGYDVRALREDVVGLRRDVETATRGMTEVNKLQGRTNDWLAAIRNRLPHR